MVLDTIDALSPGNFASNSPSYSAALLGAVIGKHQVRQMQIPSVHVLDVHAVLAQTVLDCLDAALRQAVGNGAAAQGTTRAAAQGTTGAAGAPKAG